MDVLGRDLYLLPGVVSGCRGSLGIWVNLLLSHHLLQLLVGNLLSWNQWVTVGTADGPEEQEWPTQETGFKFWWL